MRLEYRSIRFHPWFIGFFIVKTLQRHLFFVCFLIENLFVFLFNLAGVAGLFSSTFTFDFHFPNLFSALNAGKIFYALNILRNTALAQSIRKVEKTF